MILSFNPIFDGDRQIICAGRDPDEKDLAAAKSAHAVILPQGCRPSLYHMAKNNCPHVFPNYDARFSHPGKLKQIMLFREHGAPFPETRLFDNVRSFTKSDDPLLQEFPYVFKFDWGGEGDFVYLIESTDQLKNALDRAQQCEATGQRGFLTQSFIPGTSRTLRVVVINEKVITYWRIHPENQFHGSLSKGARIDMNSDSNLMEVGKKQVRRLCRKTGINLAGFDLIFSMGKDESGVFFLEINYFFGRTGLGGSQTYYDLLTEEIKRWICGIQQSGTRNVTEPEQGG
jgi:ribosomal protein S6--L-glutamate ligase